MKKASFNLKIFVKQLLGLLVLVGAAYYMYQHLSHFQSWPRLNFRTIAPLIIISVAFQLFQSLIFKYQTELFNLKLSAKHWIGLSATAALYNLVFPARGGLIARAYFLQKKYQFPYSNYAGMMLITLFVAFIATAGTSIAANGWSYLSLGTFNEATLGVGLMAFLGSIIAFLVLAFFPKEKISSLVVKWPKLNSLWSGFVASTDLLHANRGGFLPLMLSFLGTIIFMAARLSFSGKLVELDIPLQSCFIIQTMVGLSVFVSFTPGNLGVKEGIIIALLSSQNVSPETAILVAGIDRLSSAFVVLALGIPFHFLLIRDREL